MNEPKRRGRPSLDPDDRAVPVSFSLPSRQYDKLTRQAQEEKITLPEVIRRKIRLADVLDDDD